MAILSECPTCHKKQSVKNRKCGCGEDLLKAKRSKRVRYWINYRMPDGKQRRESIGFSIEEAKAAEGKRRSQKRENRIFDMLPGSRMSFDELTNWYLNLKKKFIRLPKEGTKENKPKDVPINNNLMDVLTRLKPSLEIVNEGYHDLCVYF